MNRCPITYENCLGQKYSKAGLRLLSPRLEDFQDFPYTAKEQIEKALELADKLSIQGVQPKLSVKLVVSHRRFEIKEKGGTFILKPPHEFYEELPQNEDVTMKMASLVGLVVPTHGMVYNIDGSLSYFIKRFDRIAHGHKLGVEDFTQLLGFERETKYASSMEAVASVIEKFCSFPAVEKLKLFRLVLFSFLTGNEDMHLKNFSLITQIGIVKLSPCYDLLNSTIAMKNAKEEMALPLRGKKRRLKSSDLLVYYGQERLGLSKAIIEKELDAFKNILGDWHELLDRSFLSSKLQEKYHHLIAERWGRLETD